MSKRESIADVRRQMKVWALAAAYEVLEMHTLDPTYGVGIGEGERSIYAEERDEIVQEAFERWFNAKKDAPELAWLPATSILRGIRQSAMERKMGGEQ
jgi:hypothetical protein